jgi:hypothetical protein
MTERQIALLTFARNGIRPGQQSEKDELDVLVQDGSLKREDHPPLTPGGPVPIPVYRTTPLGIAALETIKGN